MIPIVSGSAQPKLTTESLSNLKIVFPPKLNERKKINDYIQIIKNKYAVLMNVTSEQIELLKERRTALISAAVTGKIDVRDWQAPSVTQTESDEVMA
jgi:type I restriction enzyme S subunit